MKLEKITVENKEFYQFRDGLEVGDLFSIESSNKDIETERVKFKEQMKSLRDLLDVLK